MPLPKRGPGRPKGARNKRSIELEAAARAKGCTPMQVMQMTVENLVERANGTDDQDERTAFLERAAQVAAKLAPFVHPRLNAIEYKDPNRSDEVAPMGRLTTDELVERVLALRDRCNGEDARLIEGQVNVGREQSEPEADQGFR